MRLVVLGPQGAGKGTYSTLLSMKLGIPSISTGDMFRDEIMRKTALGKKIEGFLKRGALVPDAVAVSVIRRRLGRKDCARGFILDGFPRTLNQAKELERIVAPSKVLYFNASHRVVIERLQSRLVCAKCKAIFNIRSNPPKQKDSCDNCGSVLQRRQDESDAAIRARLEAYRKETLPLIGYYKKKGMLAEIDANRPFEKVNEIIGDSLRALEAAAQ